MSEATRLRHDVQGDEARGIARDFFNFTLRCRYS
jgi:hypothetical protein